MRESLPDQGSSAMLAREKPPCEYPQEDGRRCSECAACHTYNAEMAVDYGRGVGRLRRVDEALPTEYELGAMAYYLESYELHCKYDKGTSDATRAEIHGLIDKLKAFRRAAHFPRPTNARPSSDETQQPEED